MLERSLTSHHLGSTLSLIWENLKETCKNKITGAAGAMLKQSLVGDVIAIRASGKSGVLL